MAKAYPKRDTRCDHILIIKQSTRARRARIRMSKGSIPGDTRLLPLTLLGSTTIRVSLKGMAGGDSRHHQKDWKAGLWNTESILTNITPQLSRKDCREENGHTTHIHGRETPPPS